VNLWRVTEFPPEEFAGKKRTGPNWIARLAQLRTEFEYAVIHGPAVGISSEAAFLAELTDGIVLVLEANITRRASIRAIKETLEAEGVRILGTILSRRGFPIPERLYTRL
jgi:Mrp family chromosome partitioning ATPase